MYFFYFTSSNYQYSFIALWLILIFLSLLDVFSLVNYHFHHVVLKAYNILHGVCDERWPTSRINALGCEFVAILIKPK
jgi:hypothetical protein